MIYECSDCGEQFDDVFLDCCPFCESHNIFEVYEYTCNKCDYIWDSADVDGICPICGSDDFYQD